MIRLLVYIAALLALALGFSWLADRPGEVSLIWQGQKIETDLMTVVVGLLVLIFAVVVVLWLVTGLVRTPFAIGSFFERRRREKGWRALSQGMIAAGAGDPTSTARLAAEARRILGNEPLALLLEAQSAQLGGNRDAARQAFERMLEEPETRLLGLRGLYVEAQRYGETAAARHFATEANVLSPRLAWAGQALLEFQGQGGEWAGALETLDRNARNKIIDRARTKRLRAVLMTARAMDIEQGEPDLARSLALEAHALAPEFVPAAVIAGRLLTRQGDIKRASRVLEATWRHNPHPDLAAAYARVRPGDRAQDRLNRVKELIKIRAHHPECFFAIAGACLDARDFEGARNAMKPLLATGPTRRACLMMADIEEAEHGDKGRVREWLSRAVRSPRDATWVADGYVSDVWAPVSPVTGRLDAFEWIVPPEDVKALPVSTLPEAGPAVPPVAVASELPSETPDMLEPAKSGEDQPATVVAIAAAPVAGTPGGGAAQPQTGPASVPGVARSARSVAFPLGYAPDDPGTAAQTAEEASRENRYRLYS